MGKWGEKENSEEPRRKDKGEKTKKQKQNKITSVTIQQPLPQQPQASRAPPLSAIDQGLQVQATHY
jgi:hypothetical protein